MKVWDVVREFIPEDKRRAAACGIINVFESEDCDTIDEAEQLCEDAGIV